MKKLLLSILALSCVSAQVPVKSMDYGVGLLAGGYAENNKKLFSKLTDVEKSGGEDLGIHNLRSEKDLKHVHVEQPAVVVSDGNNMRTGRLGNNDRVVRWLEARRESYKKKFPGQECAVDKKAEAYLIRVLTGFETTFRKKFTSFKLEPFLKDDKDLPSTSWTNKMLQFRSEPNLCHGKGVGTSGGWIQENAARLRLQEVFVSQETPQDVPEEFVQWSKFGTQAYKIHLMPFKQDIPIVVYRLIVGMLDHKVLQENIYEFKFCLNMPSLKPGRARVPTIVIYPGPGKEAAQAVLNAIYALFDDMEGLDACPRWNKKVTSLIYWAQGDGQIKDTHPYLFEPAGPGGDLRVCYRSDITGKKEEYHLADPSLVKNKKENV